MEVVVPYEVKSLFGEHFADGEQIFFVLDDEIFTN